MLVDGKGSGSAPGPIITDPNPEGPKTYGSGTLYTRLQRHIRQRSVCANIVIACQQKEEAWSSPIRIRIQMRQSASKWFQWRAVLRIQHFRSMRIQIQGFDD